MDKFKNAVDNFVNAGVETHGDAFQRMLLVQIGATQREIEKHAKSKKAEEIILYATYKGVMQGLQSSLGLYEDFLTIKDIQ